LIILRCQAFARASAASFDANRVAVGLTGYVNDATAARRNLLQRINDWIARAPQIQYVMASCNDGVSPSALAAIDANMGLYLRALPAALLATYIAIGGCPNDSGNTKAGVFIRSSGVLYGGGGSAGASAVGLGVN
jgi:hypothetical protein